MRALHRAVVGLCAAALLFAVAVPHVHTDPAHMHSGEACRPCKLQDGFSATPQATSASALPPAVVAVIVLPRCCAARALFVARHFSSRAPPISS